MAKSELWHYCIKATIYTRLKLPNPTRLSGLPRGSGSLNNYNRLQFDQYSRLASLEIFPVFGQKFENEFEIWKKNFPLVCRARWDESIDLYLHNIKHLTYIQSLAIHFKIVVHRQIYFGMYSQRPFKWYMTHLSKLIISWRWGKKYTSLITLGGRHNKKNLEVAQNRCSKMQPDVTAK